MITRLQIDGMTCQHCVRAVFTALTPVAGITSADVTIGGAEIEHDGRATFEALRDAVAEAGYEVHLVTEQKRRLPIL